MTTNRQYYSRQLWSTYTPMMAASDLCNRANVDNTVNFDNNYDIFCIDLAEPYYCDIFSNLNFGHYT